MNTKKMFEFGGGEYREERQQKMLTLTAKYLEQLGAIFLPGKGTCFDTGSHPDDTAVSRHDDREAQVCRLARWLILERARELQAYKELSISE
jgi:hypothetical protein